LLHQPLIPALYYQPLGGQLNCFLSPCTEAPSCDLIRLTLVPPARAAPGSGTGGTATPIVKGLPERVALEVSVCLVFPSAVVPCVKSLSDKLGIRPRRESHLSAFQVLLPSLSSSFDRERPPGFPGTTREVVVQMGLEAALELIQPHVGEAPLPAVNNLQLQMARVLRIGDALQRRLASTERLPFSKVLLEQQVVANSVNLFDGP
jgi:hypothetical protein